MAIRPRHTMPPHPPWVWTQARVHLACERSRCVHTFTRRAQAHQTEPSRKRGKPLTRYGARVGPSAACHLYPAGCDHTRVSSSRCRTSLASRRAVLLAWQGFPASAGIGSDDDLHKQMGGSALIAHARWLIGLRRMRTQPGAKRTRLPLSRQSCWGRRMRTSQSGAQASTTQHTLSSAPVQTVIRPWGCGLFPPMHPRTKHEWARPPRALRAAVCACAHVHVHVPVCEWLHVCGAL